MAENDDGGSGVHIFGGFEAADGSASNFMMLLTVD